MMQLLVDHVEVSLSAAELMRGCYPTTFKEFLWYFLPQMLSPDWLIRSSRRGLNFLEWEQTLDSPAFSPGNRNPTQAAAAREIETIYLWWVRARPKRPIPEEVVGLNSVYAKITAIREKTKQFGLDMIPKELDAEWQAAIYECDRIETGYAAEDHEMMIRLVNILPYLWV